ncbi:MAG: flavodoxin family protein [Oscillospiraceae bacterium]|nr:flavodoxin family protein [Oscillospiraceae bacterium]
MTVLAVNGSPRKGGNTAFAIETIANVLKESDIKTDIVNIGKLAVRGCVGCKTCAKIGKCVFDDEVNEIADRMAKADGIIIGSPVYYAGINGTLKSFLDRAFYSRSAVFRLKPCAAVVAARRAGVTSALTNINLYFELAEMLVVPSAYWSGVFGTVEGDAESDLEGVQLMKQLGKNMAYIMKLVENSALPIPEKDERVRFNYIRN